MFDSTRLFLPCVRHLVVIIGCLLGLAVGVSAAEETAPGKTGDLPPGNFVNPIGEGADPWVVRDPVQKRFLWCYSQGNRSVAINTSDTLTSLGKEHVIWQAPASGPYAREIWAPELHFLDGRWHIYFAASDGKNENHRAYVLKSKTEDALGEYDLVGPLKTGEGDNRDSPNIWAIDMTVLNHKDRRYAIWSGWDAPGTDQQFLYIAEMESPTKLTGPRVRLCEHDDYLWERIEPQEDAKGLNEGPQVFQSGGKTAIVYSCGASWMPTYKLGMLELHGDNPLNPASWTKRPEPVFQSTETTYGVGHSCFVRSLGDDQWWHVFHAKRDRNPGWRRAIYVQPMQVDADGYPDFGKPVDAGAVLSRPSGEETSGLSDAVEGFSYYGHHQYIEADADSIRLGVIPGEPINEYRSGEKVVFDQSVANDFEMTVSIDFLGNSRARDAGILFRCSAPSVGYDSQRGYFAGLIPQTGILVVGKTDGVTWQELARADASINPTKPQVMSVQMNGDKMTIRHNGKVALTLQDASYVCGCVGLRVVDTEAEFRNWHCKPL